MVARGQTDTPVLARPVYQLNERPTSSPGSALDQHRCVPSHIGPPEEPHPPALQRNTRAPDGPEWIRTAAVGQAPDMSGPLEPDLPRPEHVGHTPSEGPPQELEDLRAPLPRQTAVQAMPLSAEAEPPKWPNPKRPRTE